MPNDLTARDVRSRADAALRAAFVPDPRPEDVNALANELRQHAMHLARVAVRPIADRLLVDGCPACGDAASIMVTSGSKPVTCAYLWCAWTPDLSRLRAWALRSLLVEAWEDAR